jgi:putative inorganic carbon (hco3(-)) transporter
MIVATRPIRNERPDAIVADSPLADVGSQRLPFALLATMLAFFVLRPWDIYPDLATIRPMMIITSVTVLTFLMGRPRIEFWQVRPAKLLVAFLGLISFSVLFSYWPSQSASIAVDYLKQLILFVLIVNLITSTGRLKIYIGVFVAACTWHGIAAVTDFASGDGERLVGISEPYFGDPNDLALSLVMVLPLAWWLASAVETVWARLAIYTAMLILVAGILATQSRGGLLALIAAVVVMVILQGREKRGTLLLTLMAAMAFSILFLPAESFERYLTIPQYQKDESAMTRLAVWKAGASMCVDHPLTGVGAGTFETVYGNWYIDRKGAGNIWRAAHSSYIEIAAELGVVGLVVFLAILGSALFSLRETRQLLKQLAIADPHYCAQDIRWLDRLNSSLFAAIVGFLVGAAFLSRGYDMIFMILLALIAVVLRSARIFATSYEQLHSEVLPDPLSSRERG